MNKSIDSIEDLRARGGNGIPLGETVRGMLVFTALVLLMNGSALLRNATLMEYGVARDIAVTVTRPVAAVSAILHVDRLRTCVESLPILEER